MEAACSGRTGAAETRHPICDKHQHGRTTCWAAAHFELQELNLGSNLMGHTAPEALASCHNLKGLGLKSGLSGFNAI